MIVLASPTIAVLGRMFKNDMVAMSVSQGTTSVEKDPRCVETRTGHCLRTAPDQGAGDAKGFPFSMTKVSISLLPDTEQASWGTRGCVS